MHSLTSILLNLLFTKIHITSVPPDILDNQTSHDMNVQEGENVTLKCGAIGSPSPSIEWRREKGKPLVGGQESKQNLESSSRTSSY